MFNKNNLCQLFLYVLLALFLHPRTWLHGGYCWWSCGFLIYGEERVDQCTRWTKILVFNGIQFFPLNFHGKLVFFVATENPVWLNDFWSGWILSLVYIVWWIPQIPVWVRHPLNSIILSFFRETQRNLSRFYLWLPWSHSILRFSFVTTVTAEETFDQQHS